MVKIMASLGFGVIAFSSIFVCIEVAIVTTFISFADYLTALPYLRLSARAIVVEK